MSEWQDIETAPKDGTIILAYDLDIGVGLGYWADDQDGEYDEPLGWMIQDAVGEYLGDITHWQLLPPPPVESGSQAANEKPA